MTDVRHAGRHHRAPILVEHIPAWRATCHECPWVTLHATEAAALNAGRVHLHDDCPAVYTHREQPGTRS